MPSADAANEPIAPTGEGEAVSPHAIAAAEPLAVRVSSALADLGGRPLGEHAEAYERVHADLNAALAEIETA